MKSTVEVKALLIEAIFGEGLNYVMKYKMVYVNLKWYKFRKHFAFEVFVKLKRLPLIILNLFLYYDSPNVFAGDPAILVPINK